MRRLSISLRLAAWYACILAVGLAVFGVAMRFVLAESMLSWKDRTLQMRATRMEAVLSAASLEAQSTVDARLEELAGVLPEGEWIEIVRPDGERVFPRAEISPASTAAGTSCQVGSLRNITVDKEHFRQLCQPVLYAGRPALLLVPSPLFEDRILLRNFTWGMYKAVPLILLVSGLGGYMLSRRALRPVDLLIAEARAVTGRDLSRRLTVPVAGDQLRRLAVEWNDLLTRIEEAMVRMTQFTADASHELRSPLAYIRTTAEYSLGNPDADEDSREAFRAIVEEARMTGDLLENLLTLAQADANQLPKRIDLVDVMIASQEVCRHFMSALDEKGQRLDIMTPEDVSPVIQMNALHLRRVLTAIVDNAMKYTAGKGCISIRCERKDDLLLRIVDNGVGIAPENLPRIFDRFFRVDQARSEMREGVGLGLPIAKWLMELYGGRILVESKLGGGTIVTLAFPGRMCGNQLPGPLQGHFGDH